MHRHGYKGTKFHRERDQREALTKGLAEALIIHESIETTLPKAKTVVPYTERLITKAKKGGLHNRRQIIAALQQISTAHKLVDEITPKLGGRTSGYLRIRRTVSRRGDNAQMARVSFVDDLRVAPVAQAANSAELRGKGKELPSTTVKTRNSKPAASTTNAKKATAAKVEVKK